MQEGERVSCPHSTRIELICPTRQISLQSASLDDEGSKNPLRVNFNLRSDFKVIWVVQSLSKKYSAFAVGQISATSSRHLIPQEGRFAIVTNAGWDVVDATASARKFVRRAVSVSEQRRAGRTALFPPVPDVSAGLSAEAFGEGGSRTAKPCGPDARCWRQVRGGMSCSTGPSQAIHPLTTVTRRIRRRGEHGISRKAIAQGMPECLR